MGRHSRGQDVSGFTLTNRSSTRLDAHDPVEYAWDEFDAMVT